MPANTGTMASRSMRPVAHAAAGFHVEREALQPGSTAALLLWVAVDGPGGAPAQLSLVQDLQLAVLYTDADGVLSSQKIWELQLRGTHTVRATPALRGPNFVVLDSRSVGGLARITMITYVMQSIWRILNRSNKMRYLMSCVFFGCWLYTQGPARPPIVRSAIR